MHQGRRTRESDGFDRDHLPTGLHSAASLGLEAGVDIKVVSKQLGHASTAFTQDVYQHVRRALHDEAAERVDSLLPRPGAGTETGS